MRKDNDMGFCFLLAGCAIISLCVGVNYGPTAGWTCIGISCLFIGVINIEG